MLVIPERHVNCLSACCLNSHRVNNERRVNAITASSPGAKNVATAMSINSLEPLPRIISSGLIYWSLMHDLGIFMSPFISCILYPVSCILVWEFFCQCIFEIIPISIRVSVQCFFSPAVIALTAAGEGPGGFSFEASFMEFFIPEFPFKFFYGCAGDVWPERTGYVPEPLSLLATVRIRANDLR